MNIQNITLTNKTGVLLTLFWLFLFNFSVTQAEELVFTPATPIVEIGQQITLSVSGASGKITWTPSKGQIRGEGNQVAYIAPAQAGVNGVMVVDSAGNVGSVKIIVTPKDLVSLENATWKLFTSRANIQTIALSDDGKTLWVGSWGGLEQRDAVTGKLERVYTTVDGLPGNKIVALASDGNDGLWIGTWSGIAHFSNNGELMTISEPDSSGSQYGFSYYMVKALASDINGTLWVMGKGSSGDSVAHLNSDNKWKVISVDFDLSTVSDSSNIGVGNNFVSDGNGGVWLGTKEKGLVHLNNNDEWTFLNTDNSDLPSNKINSLAGDNGDLWVGTDNGLAHFDFISDEWRIFNLDNSQLPHNQISALVSDNDGGVWVGGGGINLAFIAHRNNNDEWRIFNLDSLTGVPIYSIEFLVSDGKDGIWLGAIPYGHFTPMLAYLGSHDDKPIFQEKANLQSIYNTVHAIINDGNGGLWIGTDGGLVHRSKNENWRFLNTGNSGLPYNSIKSLARNGNNGLWVGTLNGLAYLNNNEQNEHWEVWNTNSGLPSSSIEVLVSDNNGGVWLSTRDKGLAHLTVNGEWTILDKDNSALPDNNIKVLTLDGSGGLWVGTNQGGLAHLSSDNEWISLFNTDNGLPSNQINAIMRDNSGGLWAGTSRGLAHFSNEKWTVIEVDEDRPRLLPINAIINDGSGGLWLGTAIDGLAHMNARREWTFFNTRNSSLPADSILDLISDNSGGVWIGMWLGGLAHLTFGQKIKLCTQTQVDATDCEALLTGKRAAIIIAGGGNQSTNSLWDTTEAISNRIYKAFRKRGFDKSEIYYLSPKSWADFNGDGSDDYITQTREEGTLTVDDVRIAFEWAKTGGKIDQPLYVFFVDHGGEEKLQLAKNVQMQASEFKTMLDDYQNSTGNEVILVIEACYSGSLIEALAAPKRAIISSAKANELAYFVEKRGFTHFFVDNLRKGMNFLKAFNDAVPKQDKLLGKLAQRISGVANNPIKMLQTPQFDDNADSIFTIDDGQWLKQVYVNGHFKTGDITLAVNSLTTSTSLSVDQPVILKANASTVAGRVVRVWAVIRPPKINLVLDSNGTPILAYPRSNLYRTEAENIWQTSWNDAVYNGDYEITFYAEDNDGNIASSDNSVIISITGGVEPPEQANVQIILEKKNYRLGEPFKAEMIEKLGWGYDLYAAIVMPDGNFIALKNTNNFAQLNQPRNWLKSRTQNQSMTLLDLTLPTDLATGEYCLYGILSPERENVFETMEQNLWVMERRCFEVVK